MMDEPRFKIDGADYPIPVIDELSIDEAGIFHDWSGVHVEEVFGDTPFNSRMIAGLMQIAYMRGNPGLPAQAARAVIGQSNLMDALAALAAAEKEDDAGPPELTLSEPAPSGSPENSDDSPSTSGTDSTTLSAGQANGRKHGGTPALVTSVTSGSPTSGS